MKMSRVYACIDLKSFYASVECVLRGLNPLNTNLVVADSSRTEKTVCLAITPPLKQYGLGGRARLFEINQKIKEINRERYKKNNYKKFIGKSYLDDELKKNKRLELDFIIAKPRMRYYMKYSTNIYNIYLKYLSSDDIYVYSIDEIFCDITNYLKLYKMTPSELVTKMIKDVYDTTGITATAGIGTNLFLAKVAMDVLAKHASPNHFGVRIAYLDEMNYRKKIWHHRPITDIWRVGKGIASKLEKHNIYTMGDIAKTSLSNENLFYKLFGVNAETLIDHAWGYEPCTMEIIKKYKPLNNSISSGQVLHCPYNYEDAELIIKEMADLLALDLVSKNYITDQIVITIGYDINNKDYDGEMVFDQYGRSVPKSSHGTININHKTSSSKIIMDKSVELYRRITNPKLLIKRINISVNNLVNEDLNSNRTRYEQFDLFTNYDLQDKQNETNIKMEHDEKKIQSIILNIKNKYGKNAILKGMNLNNAGTTIDRNRQVGGHHE
ncbi:MAG: DNA methylase [Bacilli bacterium]|nr:DNA methylase [Bacilli bacterium]